jgi:hypothetical protein
MRRTILLTLACCGANHTSIRWSSSGRDHADLQFEATTGMGELVVAIDAALGRRGSSIDDCALTVFPWEASAPIRIRAPSTQLTATTKSQPVDLGAITMCGAVAGPAIASLMQGAVFLTPTGGGVWWTDRPMLFFPDPPVPIRWDEAIQRLAAMNHDTTRVVFAADTSLAAYDMMHEAQLIAAMGISVVVYAFEPKNTNELLRSANAKHEGATEPHVLVVGKPDPL